ncbi:hypothetical protein AB4084_27735, partial [Lysobacter sp. 2RAB21]
MLEPILGKSCRWLLYRKPVSLTIGPYAWLTTWEVGMGIGHVLWGLVGAAAHAGPTHRRKGVARGFLLALLVAAPAGVIAKERISSQKSP